MQNWAVDPKRRPGRPSGVPVKRLWQKRSLVEAKVPFIPYPVLDFVEMLVGVGAACAWTCLEQAGKADAASSSSMKSTPSAAGMAQPAVVAMNVSRPLNQMLVPMDRFEGREGIIVIAATSRPDII